MIYTANMLKGFSKVKVYRFKTPALRRGLGLIIRILSYLTKASS